MKSLRLLLCALPLALTGCSTLSSINWSAAYPWNWFGSSTEVTEQGVGKITAATSLDQDALQDALGGGYRLRSGMKTENGNIVRYFEALKGDTLALVINGDKGTVNRIAVMDDDIPTESGVKWEPRLANSINRPSATAPAPRLTTAWRWNVKRRAASTSAISSPVPGVVRKV